MAEDFFDHGLRGLRGCFLSVRWAIRGFNSLCRGLAGHHDRLVGVGRRFLSDEPWIAEPDRYTEPPFALGTGTLEF